jgi:hypothetical protein
LAKLQIATPPDRRKQGGLRGERQARFTEMNETREMPNSCSRIPGPMDGGAVERAAHRLRVQRSCNLKKILLLIRGIYRR